MNQIGYGTIGEEKEASMMIPWFSAREKWFGAGIIYGDKIILGELLGAQFQTFKIWGVFIF